MNRKQQLTKRDHINIHLKMYYELSVYVTVKGRIKDKPTIKWLKWGLPKLCS